MPGASSQDPIRPPESRRQTRMMEPSILLLLLERGVAHGYELREEIERMALTESEVDGAAVYRTLRWLETHGQVRSVWDTAGTRAPRRRYQLTELGRKSLTLWADLLRHRRAALDTYLDRYQEAVAKAQESGAG